MEAAYMSIGRWMDTEIVVHVYNGILLRYKKDAFESVLMRWVKVNVAQSCPTLCNPMIAHGILQARILEWIAIPFSRGSSQPKDQTQVPCIAGRFLPAESRGKPKNTGMGSLSLLQQIFPTQQSNRGLMHCRQILYQLSYQDITWL